MSFSRGDELRQSLLGAGGGGGLGKSAGLRKLDPDPPSLSLVKELRRLIQPAYSKAEQLSLYPELDRLFYEMSEIPEEEFSLVQLLRQTSGVSNTPKTYLKGDRKRERRRYLDILRNGSLTGYVADIYETPPTKSELSAFGVRSLDFSIRENPEKFSRVRDFVIRKVSSLRPDIPHRKYTLDNLKQWEIEHEELVQGLHDFGGTGLFHRNATAELNRKLEMENLTHTRIQEETDRMYQAYVERILTLEEKIAQYKMKSSGILREFRRRENLMDRRFTTTLPVIEQFTQPLERKMMGEEDVRNEWLESVSMKRMRYTGFSLAGVLGATAVGLGITYGIMPLLKKKRTSRKK